MNTLKEILLNSILILFPILLYFVYSCCHNIRKRENNSSILNLALITSVYLILTYSNIESNSKVLLFCNIPILIAYLKKERIMGIALSIAIVLYSFYYYDINIYIITLKYFGYFILYLMCLKNKISDFNYILIVAIFQGFFLSFENYFITNINVQNIIILFVTIMVYYLIPFAILNMFNSIDSISTIFLSVKELEREKQIKNSLFRITHEIKNPIAVCKGYIDMMEPQNIEKVEKYVPIIKQELDRSLNIMNDFMEFSKIKLNKEIIDINLLLEDVYDGFKLLLINKNIDINFTPMEEEIYILGDYNRLKQVLLNILKNSAEAITGKGEISINIKLKKNEYCIIIKDNGKGMTKEELLKVKDMFYTTKVNGSGLGVSLSNEIIKSHNGTLNYESEIEKGTKVTIILPLKKDF